MLGEQEVRASDLGVALAGPGDTAGLRAGRQGICKPVIRPLLHYLSVPDSVELKLRQSYI